MPLVPVQFVPPQSVVIPSLGRMREESMSSVLSAVLRASEESVPAENVPVEDVPAENVSEENAPGSGL